MWYWANKIKAINVDYRHEARKYLKRAVHELGTFDDERLNVFRP